MAGVVQEILAKLLEPDNLVIQEATKQLKEAFKDPGILPALCQILGTSTEPQIRQYSAVLIRRKIQKSRHWNSLGNDMKESIRGNILQLLVQEPVKSVRAAIGTIVGVVAKHDLPKNEWPALFEFVTIQVKSSDVQQREIGMFVLYTLASDAGEQLKPHLVSMMQILIETIKDTESRLVPYYSIRCMSELVYLVGVDESKYIQDNIPQILLIIQELIKVNEEEACECMEIFDELLESEVAVLVPHVKTVVEFCLQVAAQSTLGDAIRVKAMSFISSLTRLKKNAILKHKLVEPILHMLFPILCSNEEEDDEEDAEEIESHTPVQYIPQVLDSMSLHLPPKKFIPILMPLIEKSLASESPYHRKAGYISMAIIVEGCADYIMNKHLKAVLHCVVTGLNDADNNVRNSALFALGQFSEHLQPDISKFAEEILPMLFTYLGNISQEPDKNPKGLTKIYYALEVFCENLEGKILPYLPPLMNHLLSVLKSDHMRSKELAISAIGATAAAAKEAMKPYFNEIIEHLKSYLVTDNTEDMKKLQLQTIDTLGILARNCGSDIFLPLSKECLQLGVNLLDSAEDPDLKRCVYSLFAAISLLLKSEMSEYLEKIVNCMLFSVKSNEGVTAHFKEESEAIAVFNEDDLIDEEDIGDEDTDEEEEDKIEGVSVENAYLDEKEDACCSLGEIAENVGAPFMPYLEQSYKEVFNLLDYPAEGVKKVSIVSVSQFCICVHKVCIETGLDQSALKEMLTAVVPRFLDIIKVEEERTVVMAAVDSVAELLNKIGVTVLEMTGATNAILTSMKEIFTHKVACQDIEDEDDDDEQQAELDAMLIESAGDVLPTMAKLVGGPDFLPFFHGFLTDLLKRLKTTSSVPEKSFAVGTLAEVVQACGPASAAFVDTLYPLFMRLIQDDDEEVKSNAVFAVGVLAQYGGEKIHRNFPVILKALFDIVTKEEENARVLDNVCAAICRLIMTNPASIPFDKVIPAIVSFLPLKEDYEENHTVYHCLIELYVAGNPQIIQCTPQLLSSIATVLGTDEIKPETQSILVQFTKHVNEKFPEEFQKVKSTLPSDLGNKLDSCLLMVNGTGT